MPKITSYIALLVFINFVSGVAVMVVELTGIRLLAPLFGTSIYTWTSLIAVVLVAISLGGFIGGALADSDSSEITLFDLLLGGAVFTAFVPVIYFMFGGFAQGLSYISGPTVISTLLFAIPAVLFGAISPMVTRLVSAQHLDKHVGFSSGITNMSGALGSFIGTFVAGFYLIPSFDYRVIFVGTAIIMALCGAAYYFSAKNRPEKKKAIYLASVTVFAALAVVATVRDNPERIILDVESPYQKITLITNIDNENRVYLSLFNDNALQGSMYLDKDESPHPYSKYWNVARTELANVKNALVLGGGAYTYPKAIERAFPRAKIDVIEIDPVVSDIASVFYGLDKYKNITTYTDDARYYLSKTNTKYDVVIVDVFKGLFGVPSHLVTADFFEELKSSMTPDGIVLMNLIAGIDDEGQRFPHALNNTVMSVFDSTRVFKAENEETNVTGVSNFLLMASDTFLSDDELKVVTRSTQRLLDTELPDYGMNDVTNGMIFTDFKNPVERYTADLVSTLSK